MDGRGLRRLLALLFAFALVAAACGGDSDTDSEAESTDEETSAEEVAGAPDQDVVDEAIAEAAEEEDEAPDEEAGPAPANIEELEADWARQRQITVDLIKENGWGIDEATNTVSGPGGYTIDLNDCPADWNDTAGIGDTIKIGHTTALSGNLAAYGNIAFGMEAYFDYINDSGGVGGVPLELIIKDDQYVSTQTIEAVDELLQSEDVFALVTLGSPNTLAVRDTLNNNCVPDPFVMSGLPAWGDPENYPWISGLQLAYNTEAVLWGGWIAQNLADQLPVKVSALVMENDFGLAYEGGFHDFAEANPDVVSEFNAVRADAAAPTVTNEMTTIASQEPDVFISMTAGNPCLLAVQEAGRLGMTELAAAGELVLFTPSVCADQTNFLDPAGEASDGWWVINGGTKSPTDPQWADDPFISWLNSMLADAGLDVTVATYATGAGFFGWSIAQALLIAADLDGGLTRTNLEIALRSMEFAPHPYLLDEITFKMNGVEDAFFVEGSQFSQYDFEGGTWVQSGGVVNLEGQSSTCPWLDTGGCG